MSLQVVWYLFGWLAIVVYLVVSGTVLLSLWRPKGLTTSSLSYLLLGALIAHLFYLAEGVITGWLRLDTPEAVAVVLGWLVAGSAFIKWRWGGMSAPSGFLLPLSAAFLVFALFEKPTYLPSELRRDMLLMHVALMVGGYLLLMLAFATALVHLLTRWSLKRKRSLSLLDRLPPLELTDRLTSQLVLVGFPLLTLGMLVGMVWARWEGRAAWSDPKVVASFLTWAIFGAYLHARFVRRWEAGALNWILIIGSLCLLVTFLVVRHTLAMEG